jgi:RNA polymerase sigma factor (TIGR02999 family)
MTDSSQITVLLQRMREGDQSVNEQLLANSYKELRQLAQSYMNRERPNHTLQATALVHEAYLRLAGGQKVEWRDRAHFFGVLANQMRQILVDYARRARAEKRGGDAVRISLDETNGVAGPRAFDVLAIHEALSRLAEIDARAARVVELRFFGGLTEEEAAAAIGIALATLKRDWTFAKSWLFAMMSGAGERVT